MTITIEIPDEAAADRVRASAEAQGQDVNTFATALLLDATRPVSSVMGFSRAGAGRPGALREDVQKHINALRDEWNQRSA